MKRMKKLLGLALILALAVTCLCACGPSEEDVIAEISGKWKGTNPAGEELAKSVLENADFTEEEIALCDLDSLESVDIVEFYADKTYRFTTDVPGSKQCVRQFFIGAMKDLYENRAVLNEIYEFDFIPLTEDEFYEAYASMYNLDSLDSLMDLFTENSLDYEYLGSYWETGTYYYEAPDLMCTIDGEDEAESLGFIVEENSLTLIFEDITQKFNRMK